MQKQNRRESFLVVVVEMCIVSVVNELSEVVRWNIVMFPEHVAELDQPCGLVVQVHYTRQVYHVFQQILHLQCRQGYNPQ